MIRLRHGTWVAVCDGSKSLLLENTGDHEYPKLETRLVMTHENPPTHLQGAAAPGRAFAGTGERRAAVADTDRHEQAERHFLVAFARQLEHALPKRNGGLILVAPPHALGTLRPHLGEHTRTALAGELARDYVKLPLYEIERLLSVPGH